jgi:hypothetical protein
MKVGFLNLLTLIFVVAKLLHFINWSWWLVFAPTLISIPARHPVPDPLCHRRCSRSVPPDVASINLATISKRSASTLEERFAKLWNEHGGPPLTREARLIPKRRFRFDFSHAPSKTAIEIEGGIWGSGPPCPVCKQRRAGRHNTAVGFMGDCEKYNLAAANGWSVFRLVGKQITDEWVLLVISIIHERTEHAPQ